MCSIYIFVQFDHISFTSRFLRDTYISLVVQHEFYGTLGLFLKIVYKLCDGQQLFLFWLTLFISQAYVVYFIPLEAVSSERSQELIKHLSSPDTPLYYVLVSIAAEVCNNYVTLLATFMAVVYFARGALILAYWFTAGRGKWSVIMNSQMVITTLVWKKWCSTIYDSFCTFSKYSEIAKPILSVLLLLFLDGRLLMFNEICFFNLFIYLMFPCYFAVSRISVVNVSIQNFKIPMQKSSF